MGCRLMHAPHMISLRNLNPWRQVDCVLVSGARLLLAPFNRPTPCQAKTPWEQYFET